MSKDYTVPADDVAELATAVNHARLALWSEVRKLDGEAKEAHRVRAERIDRLHAGLVDSR